MYDVDQHISIFPLGKIEIATDFYKTALSMSASLFRNTALVNCSSDS